MAFEAARARSLLADGAPLIGRLPARGCARRRWIRRRWASRARRRRRRRIRRARLPTTPHPAVVCRFADRNTVDAPMTLSTRERRSADDGGAQMIPSADVERAYRSCVRITRHEAANFFYGIRLLPRPKRQAMSAVYAFARRVDDIGDGTLDVAAQARRARDRARARRPTTRGRHRRRRPGADRARGRPIPGSSSHSTRSEPDRRRRAGRPRDAGTRASTSWSSTAGTSLARSDACAWRSSARTTASRPHRWPTTSGSRCS